MKALKSKSSQGDKLSLTIRWLSAPNGCDNGLWLCPLLVAESVDLAC